MKPNADIVAEITFESHDKPSETSWRAQSERASRQFFEEVYGDGGHAFQEVSRICRDRAAQMEQLTQKAQAETSHVAQDTLRQSVKLADDHPVETSVALAAGATAFALGAVAAEAPVAIGLATLGTVGCLGASVWSASKAASNEWNRRTAPYWQNLGRSF